MIISTHLIVLKLFALDMPALILYIAGMKTKQYTIRNVPEPVDRLVRQQAKKTHKSLNAVLLAALERGVGVANEPVEYHDLDELAGSWVADPDFDAAMEAFESIDEELWK
jgi:hypothetical protein